MNQDEKQKAAEEYKQRVEEFGLDNGLTAAVIYGADWAMEKMMKQVSEKESEIQRLNKIIAQELSENDDLGCEYTYVRIMKAKCERMEKALKIIWSHLEDERNDSEYLTPVQNEMFTAIDEALRKDG